LTRASTPSFALAAKNVDGRVKPGHDDNRADAADEPRQPQKIKSTRPHP
jgi:hypothetical protein